MARPRILGGRRPVAPPVHRTRPIVASGRQIDVSDAKQLVAYRKRMSADAWQEPAWVYHATIPPLQFAQGYVKNSLSRVRPYPAVLSDDPEEGPIPLTDEAAPSGLDPDLCDEIVQRLSPFPNFMGETALKMDVSGEVYVGLMPDDDSLTGEVCRVFSSRELLATGQGWRVRESPDDNQGELIPAGTPFWRIWTPDPEFSVLPFSYMVALSGACETYLTGMRLLKAFFLSRLATTGKIVAIADEFSLESAAADGLPGNEDAGDGAAGDDTFFDDLMAASAEAILDPESASAVMNLIIRGPKELIKDGINVIDISRSMEDAMIKLRQELREEIATGVDLPRELILGLGSTNHWNAEEIKQQSWLNHLEPRAYSILSATTTAFYRPALLANDVDPDLVARSVIWYDPKWFLGEPDRAESADFGYTNMLISGDAWRAAKNYTDDDGPTEEEIEYRIEVQQKLNVRTTLRDQGVSEPPTVEPADTPMPDEMQPDNSAPETPEKQDTSAPPAPVPGATPAPAPAKAAPGPTKKAAAAAQETDRAAKWVDPPAKHSQAGKIAAPAKLAAPAKTAQPAKVTALGARLVAIERDLRTRLLEAANSTVSRALERAGVKVRSKLSARAAGQTGKALLTKFGGQPPCEIPSLVGRATVESFGLSDQELLAGALGDLEAKYRALVKRAQHAALAAVGAATGHEPDYGPLDNDTMSANHDAGWALLAAGLTGLASTALYNPHPEAPAVGEYDGTSLVPPGLIRAALEAAGGAQTGDTQTVVRGVEIPSAQSPIENGQTIPGGATMGPDMLALFADQADITANSYVWVYGDAPRRSFPPHEALDGVSFSSWNDDALINDDGWPDAYCYPSDHDGCQCDTSVSFVESGAADDQPE